MYGGLWLAQSSSSTRGKNKSTTTLTLVEKKK